MATFERLKHWIRPFWLPAYSPDLNDIERIWKREKEYTFANQLPETLEHFETVIVHASDRWLTPESDPENAPHEATSIFLPSSIIYPRLLSCKLRMKQLLRLRR